MLFFVFTSFDSVPSDELQNKEKVKCLDKKHPNQQIASSIEPVRRKPMETKEVDSEDENARLLPRVMLTVVDIDSAH